jgi:predicted DNA-binding transcriptional regulator AlpA
VTPTEQTAPPTRDGRLLRWPQVREIVGLSRTTVWRLQKAGLFPDPIEVSVNRVAWRERDVEAWCADRAPRSSRSPFLNLPPQPRKSPRPPKPPPPPPKPSRPPPPAAPPAPPPPPPPPPPPSPPSDLGPLFHRPAPPPAQDLPERRPARRRRPAVAEGQIAFDF